MLNKKTKKHLEDNFVDVCGGKMHLKELTDEIFHYMYYKNPSEMIITIKRNNRIKGYYSSIYIPIKDFEKKKR